jgi:hypothetical protein
MTWIGTLPVGFIVVVETQHRFGLGAPIALAYAATFSNPVDALNAVKKLGGPNEKVRVVAEMQKSTATVLGLSQKTVKQL